MPRTFSHAFEGRAISCIVWGEASVNMRCNSHDRNCMVYSLAIRSPTHFSPVVAWRRGREYGIVPGCSAGAVAAMETDARLLF